ncbi:MAG: hypothetical protein B7C55_13350 [Actinomycetales bacterium mxb001]|nr:MAG: hypothetical protein B7C55_13350 [Actinomycetales bacterium mxb001]
MILLNIGLENSPGWDLVPPSIREAYKNTPPLGGKKIILDEEDFSLTSSEVRDIFLLSKKYHEWYSLSVLSPWKIYPPSYVTYGGDEISSQEMYKKLDEGVFPIGFVDYNGNVIYF